MKFILLLRQSHFHGLNRLADKDYRLQWAVALILLFGAAIASLMITVHRYQSNPTFITRREHYRDRIKFPAVLICPELEFPMYKMDKFLDEVVMPPGTNKSYYLYVLRQLAAYYSPDIPYTVRDLESIEQLLAFNRLNGEELAQRLTSSCAESLIRCRWRGEIVNCSYLFRMEVTQYGFCCIFNARSLKRERQRGLVGRRKPVYANYVKTSMIGHNNGLMLVVNQSNTLRDIDLSYKWLVVLDSQRFVDAITVNGSALSPEEEVWFQFYTSGFSISEDTRYLSQHLRKCSFSEEGLKYFPIYRKRYCRLECEIALTMEKCNCTMPPYPTNSASTRCLPKAIPCAKNVASMVSPSTCGCLRTCNAENTEIKTTLYALSQQNSLIDDFYDGLDFKKVTIVRVYIDRRETMSNTRQSYFRATDLFSQLGGIFNVFFGCSVLSLLELLQLLRYATRRKPTVGKQRRDKNITQ